MKKIIGLFIVIMVMLTLVSCKKCGDKDKEKTYTITFDTDGGTLISPISTEFGAVITEPNHPTKEGYTFVGWDRPFPSTMPDENLTLIAKWVVGEFKITYNLDGGQLPIDATKYFNDGSKVELPIPTKENNLFEGWYDENDKLIVNLNNVNSNITLYAKWKEFIIGIEYSIEYVLNGGTFIDEYNSTYTSGEEYELPIPKKTAHKFVAWYDYETDEMIGKITNTMQGDIKVYALFEEATIVCDIDYHLDGGTLPNFINTSYTEGVGLASLPTPTKEGYFFKGWYTTNTFEKEVPSISSEMNGDIELYAKWIENPLVNLNFGILGDSISTFYSPTSPINSIFTGSGQYYFPKYSITDVTYTWWYKMISALQTNILVNNSYSGGTVHANGISSGNNEERINKFYYNGQSPDVIVVYLGINDTGGDFTKEFFKNEYQGMINKIKENFPSVQIFVCTLPYTPRTELNAPRLRYNEAIEEIAKAENIPVIDFASAWSATNYNYYMSDALHPNTTGMNRLSKLAIQKIKEFYNLD